MSARAGVMTGGTWCADHNKIVEFWPEENGIAEVLDENVSGGGPGYNVAVALKKLDPGLFVETVGLLGDDEDGALLLAEADRFGIGRSQLRVLKGRRTNQTAAYASAATGRRTHIFRTGAGDELTPDHFGLSGSSARILHIGLPGMHRGMDGPWGSDANGWASVLRAAREAGMETNLEFASIAPARIAAIGIPCLPHLDYLIVNDHEIGALAGTGDEAPSDAGAIASNVRTVMEKGAMRLVVVHFPEGAVAQRRGEEPSFFPALDLPPDWVVSTNGAGDAFASGLLYGLHENWPLERCVALAHATAAMSLRGATTTETIASAQECLAAGEALGMRKP